MLIFQSYYSLIFNYSHKAKYELITSFQSYYSLIFNGTTTAGTSHQGYFNPIIVLFLTSNLRMQTNISHKFQSYYSLIFNTE